MRRASWRSVPTMCSPPAAMTFSLSSAQTRSASASASAYCSGVASSTFVPRLWSSSVAMTSGLPPSRMSVPRPAMLVAMVTAPDRPAWATTSASFSCSLALRTLCLIPRRFSRSPSISLISTLIVPTRTGRPASCSSVISSMTAFHLPLCCA